MDDEGYKSRFPLFSSKITTSLDEIMSEIDSAKGRAILAEEGTPEAHLLDKLCKLIEDYEDEHYPIDPPSDSPYDSP